MHQPQLHVLALHVWARLRLRPARLRLRQSQLHLLVLHVRTGLLLRLLNSASPMIAGTGAPGPS